MKKIITFFILCILIVRCSSTKSTIENSFSNEEIQLIMNTDSLKPMRIYKINNKKDSLLLRTKSNYIKPNPNDYILKTFTNRLYATVRDSISMGVGIAAPQVGILKQIIWVQRFDKKDFPFEYYLNPEIISYSEEKQDCREGCLSIPNLLDTTRIRSKQIKIRYDNFEQTNLIETVDGFTAVIFQHEIDHLEGILFIDHLEEEAFTSK